MWLPDILGLGILALCAAAFGLCRRERVAIKGLLDGFAQGPAAEHNEPQQKRRPF